MSYLVNFRYVGSISGRQRSKSHEARSRAVRALQDPSQEPVSILRHKSASPSRAAYSAHTSPSPGRHDNRISPAHGTSNRNPLVYNSCTSCAHKFI